ncbi:response regulator transcription factor [Streptomyces sp. SID13666]|uniref:response regulator n=1 Tax=unclassified Streptomyces TaxID=2593676 RepID=UPI0013C1A395|nr:MULTISPECIES: response regulator [unclassified Streptomyces]NEA52792.1 response regulator transcription factor [Streptomyces sp. SID13666]NEA69881.1 response regulator transcription factor [Streptomyces sp. SID13588]
MTVLLMEHDSDTSSDMRSAIHANRHFRVIAHGTDDATVLALARTLLTDVVIIDARLDGIDPLALCQQLRALSPPPAVVIVAAHLTGAEPAHHLAAKGSVHLLRGSEPSDVVNALRAIGVRRSNCDPDAL